MPELLQQTDLERCLLRWTGSSYAPRYPFFEGPNSSLGLNVSQSLEDLRRWLNDIELAANDCRVPMEQYPDVAIFFLRGDLKEVMKERKGAYQKETRRSWWDWEDFKEDLRRIVEEAAKIISTTPSVSSLASVALDQMHPYIASSVRLGLVVGGTAVLLPALGLLAWKRLGAVASPALNPPN